MLSQSLRGREKKLNTQAFDNCSLKIILLTEKGKKPLEEFYLRFNNMPLPRKKEKKEKEKMKDKEEKKNDWLT